MRNLGVPRPREFPLAFSEHVYDLRQTEYLPIPDPSATRDFFEVLASRRSRRQFGLLGRAELGALFWHSAKTRASAKLAGEQMWQHRPAPSAGGRHPIDLFLVDQRTALIKLYHPHAHALSVVDTPYPEAVSALVDAVREVLDPGDGTLLWYVAQVARTETAYHEADSLIVRDAGAFAATMGLVAEALGLSFCQLGITGEPFISDALATGDMLVGVGGAIVGCRVGESEDHVSDSVTSID